MESQMDLQAHYGATDLEAKVERVLEQSGLGGQPIDWRTLAPLDQFHVRGLAASEELAEGLGLEPGVSVLDVGCGLGGPARYLAAAFGCQVTGIDLNPGFVGVARMLAERTGLAAKTSFRQADALDPPFADASFDHAWTQHVAMNIEDKAALYRSIHRVLRPGGRLAIYDVIAGDGGPLIFPVPWAGTPDISFLATPETMHRDLADAGFTERAWSDKTEQGLAWFAEQQVARQAGQAPGPLGLQVVMGPQMAIMATNLARNIAEGRARLVQVIAARL